MQKVRWVIQKNLGKSVDAKRMYEKCISLNFSCDMLDIIPFSKTIPNVPSDVPMIFYGGTNWIESISKSELWSPGVCYSELSEKNKAQQLLSIQKKISQEQEQSNC